MEKTVFKIRLHTLSPIHIGCDEVYEPTGFIIDENKLKLIEFDTLKFVEALNEKEKAELIEISESDNILDIFKFFKKAYKTEIGGREIDITPALRDHYKKILSMSHFDKKTVINQFEIVRTVFNPHDNTPYIPGSSIKGAIRTAYLNKLAKERGIKNYWEITGKLSERDLGSPEAIYKKTRKIQKTSLNGRKSGKS